MSEWVVVERSGGGFAVRRSDRIGESERVWATIIKGESDAIRLARVLNDERAERIAARRELRRQRREHELEPRTDDRLPEEGGDRPEDRGTDHEGRER